MQIKGLFRSSIIMKAVNNLDKKFMGGKPLEKDSKGTGEKEHHATDNLRKGLLVRCPSLLCSFLHQHLTAYCLISSF